MRIVLATDLYLPVYNGVVQFCRNLAEALAKDGNEVLIIAPSGTGKKHESGELGYRVAWVSSIPLPFFAPHRMSVNPAMEVKKIIQNFKPDVVHVQTPLGIGLAARNAAKKMGIPVVATNHAMPENVIENFRPLMPVADQAASVLREYGAWFHGKKIDYITMPTQAAIDMYREQSKEISVPLKAVSCGIDLSRFSPGPKPQKVMSKFGVPTDKPVVLYAGRLDSEKHLHILIRAFEQVRESEDVHLVISGKGNDEDNLKQLVDELELKDHISFLGRVSDEDLPFVYRMGTVFVMPSPAELQSIVTLEALATGVPIVVVDAGAVHELCRNGRNGYICKTDDPSDMAQKILKVLQSKDKDSLSKYSLDMAKKHDVGHTAKEYQAVYNYVIKNGAGPKRSGRSRLLRMIGLR